MIPLPVYLQFTLLASSVIAWQPDYILRISEQTISSDCQPRKSVVINGTSPGPLLRFTEGQHAWIRVFNDMTKQNTTVHWHGFSQYASPFSDGTPLVSAWPIPPGHFYDYEFQLQDGFYGTYWYHSHVDLQVLTALGPIIVDQKKLSSPVQYDEEIVMMLGDYYHAEDQTIMNGLLNDTLFQWIGDPQALLVNGRAEGKCNSTALKTGQSCDGVSCGPHQQYVKPGTRYRVRVIAGTVLSYVGMALEGHNMTLFEVDGTYIDPLPIQDLQIQAGQRYSVLIETMKSSNKTDYFWRMQTMWRPARVNGSALWTYDNQAPNDVYHDSYSTAPTPTNLNTTVALSKESFGWVSDSIVQWNQTSYPPPDSQVTRIIVLNGQQLVSGPQGKGFRWAVNNYLNNGTTPNVPFLLQFYDVPQDQRTPNYAAAIANGGLDVATQSYPAKMGEVLDIVLQNHAGPTSGMAETHPWHSHGAKASLKSLGQPLFLPFGHLSYWDMGAGTGAFSYDALNASRAQTTGKPFQRDTSVVYPGPGASYNNSVTGNFTDAGWRLFRITVDDPGAWLIHCHIAPHQIMGMMAMFMYGAEELPPIPASLFNEYKTFGGGAYGAQTYDAGEGEQEGGYQPRSYFAEVGSGTVL